jgi:methyl-accepting chemotaxis protein
MNLVAVLWVLTAIYLVVLVVALAVSVILVAFYAWRIGRSLRRIAEGLSAVQAHTAPLGSKLDAANGGLAAIARSLASTRDHLRATDQALASVVGDERREVA